MDFTFHLSLKDRQKDLEGRGEEKQEKKKISFSKKEDQSKGPSCDFTLFESVLTERDRKNL